MTDRDRLIKLIQEAEDDYMVYEMAKVAHPVGLFRSREEYIADRLIANGVIVTPCIAMVEQFIDGSLKFDRKRTAHNGRTAVIYIDKKKHSSFPLIDITDQFYNIDTAEARIKALERSNGNA